MHNRIAKLAAEANFTKFVVSDTAAISKFAELLIREAAQVADDEFNAGFYPVGVYILDHFGIQP